MNNEREPTLWEREPDRPLDFATIRNPLGPSPMTAEVEPDAQSRPDDLIADLSSLWGVPGDRIMLGRGSDPIISEIPRTLLARASRAVVPVPTYFGLVDAIPPQSMFRVPLSAESGFEFTEEAFEATIRAIGRIRPGIVWLCSPNNPTGVVIPLWQISGIAEAAGDALVIVDEAYQEIADPENAHSAMHLIGRHDNLLVTRTFSKGYGLPEIRVGAAVGSPEVIRVLSRRVRLPEGHSLAVARAAVSDQTHIWNTHFHMKHEIEFVMREIASMQEIEAGSLSANGVMIIRHLVGNLHGALLRLGITTKDFDRQDGLSGMGFVRLGILDRVRNLQLIAALRACDNGYFPGKGGIG